MMSDGRPCLDYIGWGSSSSLAASYGTPSVMGTEDEENDSCLGLMPTSIQFVFSIYII